MTRIHPLRLAVIISAALAPSLLFAQLPSAHCLSAEEIAAFKAEIEELRTATNTLNLENNEKLSNAVSKSMAASAEASKCAHERSNAAYMLFGAGCSREKDIAKTRSDDVRMISNHIQLFNQTAQLQALQIRAKYPSCN